jgi:cytochrome c
MKRLALILLLTAAAAPAARAQDAQVAAGKTAFASICALCHTAEKGRNNIGPSLFGVVGRKAGTAPGFSYSKAMTASGITWDADTIDVFITAPQARVPGTKMPYAGLKDAAKRQAIIAYLKSLHD